jgi:hypothetical protein
MPNTWKSKTVTPLGPAGAGLNLQRRTASAALIGAVIEINLPVGLPMPGGVAMKIMIDTTAAAGQQVTFDAAQSAANAQAVPVTWFTQGGVTKVVQIDVPFGLPMPGSIVVEI